jgi:DNA-binding transcriptional LysR family regulator
MDKLKQIESFVAVAARGSLTAAAQLEGVAPAIIGRRLDALEARLGVKLLVRTTRRISLTHEGSAFLEDCQRLLVDFANAEASVSAGGVKASGHLRITAPAGFGRRHQRAPGRQPPSVCGHACLSGPLWHAGPSLGVGAL